MIHSYSYVVSFVDWVQKKISVSDFFIELYRPLKGWMGPTDPLTTISVELRASLLWNMPIIILAGLWLPSNRSLRYCYLHLSRTHIIKMNPHTKQFVRNLNVNRGILALAGLPFVTIFTIFMLFLRFVMNSLFQYFFKEKISFICFLDGNQ